MGEKVGKENGIRLSHRIISPNAGLVLKVPDEGRLVPTYLKLLHKIPLSLQMVV